jgi:hypothetical protein
VVLSAAVILRTKATLQSITQWLTWESLDCFNSTAVGLGYGIVKLKTRKVHNCKPMLQSLEGLAGWACVDPIEAMTSRQRRNFFIHGSRIV